MPNSGRYWIEYQQMNTYDIAIRLTDGSRKTMTVRATTANAAERMVKER